MREGVSDNEVAGAVVEVPSDGYLNRVCNRRDYLMWGS